MKNNKNKNQKSKKSPKHNRKVFGWLLFCVSLIVMGMFMARFSIIMLTGRVGDVDLNELYQSIHNEGSILEAKRGTIYDRNSNVVAADASSYKMIAVLTDKWAPPEKPVHIQDPEAVADVLSKYLDIKRSKILKKLKSSGDQVEFGTVGSNLSYDLKTKIEKALEEKQLTGIQFEESQSRLYPNGVFASHVVGLAQPDPDNKENKKIVGVMGLEHYFDDLLSGKDGLRQYQKDSFGYALPNVKEQKKEAIDGNNLHMTLDRRLQVYLENVMDDQDAEFHPKNMTATVMDAKTGEILATSQRPSFNAMTKEGLDNTWQTFLTEFEFEPGSTMKIFTLAAAIEEHIFDPNELYQSGRYQVSDGYVNDWNREWGTITYLEGLHRSSNVAFVKLVQKMGYEKWKSYMDAFGFGRLTGISLPNEQPGSNPYTWELQKANTAFGQGVTVTPIQMLQAMTAITNGGEMIQPTIVSSVSDNEGNILDVEVTKKGTPISPETANLVLEYLAQGVESEHGTTIGYLTEGTRISTKTGTAQIINPETGQYYLSTPNYIYSSMSAFPSDNPEYIIYITVQQPELIDTTGDFVVRGIFHRLKERLLMDNHELNAEEESDVTSMISEMPDLVGLNKEAALEQLNQLRVGVIGMGDTISEQFIPPGGSINYSQRLFLKTDGVMTLPDLSGWSRNDLLKLEEFTGVKFTIEGEGFVRQQSIATGEIIEPGVEIAVTLSEPERGETEQSPDQLWNESTFNQ